MNIYETKLELSSLLQDAKVSPQQPEIEWKIWELFENLETQARAEERAKVVEEMYNVIQNDRDYAFLDDIKIEELIKTLKQ